jgi:hypothetical protein
MTRAYALRLAAGFAVARDRGALFDAGDWHDLFELCRGWPDDPALLDETHAIALTDWYHRRPYLYSAFSDVVTASSEQVSSPASEAAPDRRWPLPDRARVAGGSDDPVPPVDEATYRDVLRNKVPSPPPPAP